jgi:hypothetical protein
MAGLVPAIHGLGIPASGLLLDESDLPALVQKHFGFLVSEKGYRITSVDRHAVQLDGQSTFIRVVYAPYSFDLDVSVGNLESGESFSLGEILRCRLAAETAKFGSVQIAEDAVSDWLKQIVQVLRRYCEDVLDGDVRLFPELPIQRRRATEKFALETSLRLARAKAESAWQAKDYDAFVRALKPFEASLTEAERKKVAYAETRTGSKKEL